jgi:hypothetical protein
MGSGSVDVMRLVAPSVSEAVPEIISYEEKEHALARVLQSGIVRENTNLYSLLDYLGRKALAESPEPLKEYTIGVEALGKPADYDPRLDATVRVDIGKLRGKLKEFYQKDGATSAIRLDIPKGQYDATYARVPHLPAPQEQPVEPAPRGRRASLLVAALVLLAAVTGFAASRLLSGPASESAPLSAELQRFWQPYLHASKPVLLVYGTPMFVRLDRYLFREPRLNDPAAVAGDAEINQIAAALKTSEQRITYKFTGVGEAEAVFMLTRLLTERRAALSVKRSSNLSWEDLKGRHVILLGSQKYNPQMLRFPVQPKFEADRGRVTNLAPAPGETVEYHNVFKDKYGEPIETYAVISVFPGLDADTRMTMLSCSSNEGTGGAAEYVARPDTMKELFARMGFDARQPLPQAFQAVIKVKLNEGVPVQLSHVTHHILAR